MAGTQYLISAGVAETARDLDTVLRLTAVNVAALYRRSTMARDRAHLRAWLDATKAECARQGVTLNPADVEI